MRFSKGIQVGILLAICSGLPARGASGCSEMAQNRWLTSCGWALFEVRRAETPPHPKDPQNFSAAVLFPAQEDLSDKFVDACYELLAEPDRIPAKAVRSLQAMGWPPLADPCTRDEHLQWLRSCENDALALPGLTRTDLLATFHEEGGLSAYSERAYVHSRCFNLKVDVHFSLTVEGAESPGDVIETVSPAYIDCANYG